MCGVTLFDSPLAYYVRAGDDDLMAAWELKPYKDAKILKVSKTGHSLCQEIPEILNLRRRHSLGQRDRNWNVRCMHLCVCVRVFAHQSVYLCIRS